MGKKDNKRHGRRPDDKDNPRISLGNLKDEKEKKQDSDNSPPSFKNDQKFAIIFPAPP